MAYDKVIDSAFLNNGLTAIADKIREKTGTTDALVFPEGFVTAIDSIEGGGEAEKLNALYRITSQYIAAVMLPADWNGTTWYKSYYNSGDGWVGVDGKLIVLADVADLSGRYQYNPATNTMYYCPSASPTNYTINAYKYDLGVSLDTYDKVYQGAHNDEYPIGTYEFASDGNVYYYGEA